jgi:thiosulfate dehydrogenase
MVDRVTDVVRDPTRDSLPGDKLPDDKHVAESIVRGYHIVWETRKYAPKYGGSGMVCSNCHLNAGQRELAWPYVGVAAEFPLYRTRDGHVITLQDRIRGCFVRSLNGTAPPYDSQELIDVSAYITWLSQGTPMGGDIPWRGKNKIDTKHLIPIESLDVGKGEQLFLAKCKTCHGADGQGTDLIARAKPGPLWGPNSWNDGATAGNVYALAGFIRYSMPLTEPGSLTDTEAQLISAFINSHERPVYPHKDQDYRDTQIPVDAVYYPIYKKNPLARDTRLSAAR